MKKQSVAVRLCLAKALYKSLLEEKSGTLAGEEVELLTALTTFIKISGR